MDQHYSISEVASKLNLSQKTIRRHIASGDLISYKIGNVYRIKEENISDFLEKNRFNEKGQSTIFPEMEISKNNKKGDDVNWCKIDDLWSNKQNKKINYVDLFSGAGGISYGFKLAGLKGIYGLDNYKPAVDTYKYNFSHSIFDGDITSKDVKDSFCKNVKQKLNGEKLHIIAGGFPCQGFSMAGNRIVADPRNSLYLDMLDIVNNLSPDFVVMENVVGLRSMLKGGVERKIISDLADLNYITNVTTLCAADYEVPQTRRRVIFIANKLGIQNFHPKPLLTKENYKTTKNAIEDLMDRNDDEDFNHVTTKHRADMIKRIQKVPEGKSLYENYSDSWKKCPWDEASCTIKENHGGVNLHPKLPRVLTAREMARIQSFPDSFIFKGPKSKQMVQIGNAVPPLLGKAIGLAIIKSYDLNEEYV